MTQKMDAMLHFHQEHVVDVHESLDNINTRLGNVENRLSLRNLEDLDENHPYLVALLVLFPSCFLYP